MVGEGDSVTIHAPAFSELRIEAGAIEAGRIETGAIRAARAHFPDVWDYVDRQALERAIEAHEKKSGRWRSFWSRLLKR